MFLLMVSFTMLPLSAKSLNLQVVPLAENIYGVRSISPISEHPISGDAYFVTTEDGIVVIDTGGTPSFGKLMRQKISEITDLPVKHIIYTHWHWDHILGASGLIDRNDKEVKIYANAEFKNNINNYWSFAVNQAEHGIFGYNGDDFKRYKIIEPTDIFRDKLRLTIGETIFDLYASKGETNDQTFVHLPEQDVIFVGDHFNPMLGNPLVPEGDLDGFVSGLTVLKKLNVKKIFHGHSEFKMMTLDRHSVEKWLDITASIVGQTAKYINEGRDLSYALNHMKIPQRFEKDRFSKMMYQFAYEPFTNRLFRQKTGYYDLNPANYRPVTKHKFAKSLIELAGGVEPLIAYIDKITEQKEYQLAVELAEYGLTYAPENMRLKRLLSLGYEALAQKVGINNFYRFFSYKAASQRINIQNSKIINNKGLPK